MAEEYEFPIAPAVTPLEFDMTKFGVGTAPYSEHAAANDYLTPVKQQSTMVQPETEPVPTPAPVISLGRQANTQKLGPYAGSRPLTEASLSTNIPEKSSSAADIIGAAGSAAAGAGTLISALGKGAGTAAAATTGAAGGLGVLGTLSAAVPVIGAVGGLVALGVSWYYTYKAQKAAEEAQKENIRRADAAAAEEQRRWNINLKMVKGQQRFENEQSEKAMRLKANDQMFNQEMTREQLAMNKEDRVEKARMNRVDQAINLMIGTMQMFNSPSNREQSYNFWAQRAATAK